MNDDKTPYKLCLDVLQKLQDSGVLKDLVLVGSWCVYFYKDWFEYGDELSAVRTTDIDFLIPTPPKIKSPTDIPTLLSSMGFTVDIRGQGYMRLQHPEMVIDFLAPEKGKGIDVSFPIKDLGINATSLRFLNLLLDHLITIKSQGLSLTLPHPIQYGLHKLIISTRRRKEEKRLKDQQQGVEVLRSVLKTQDAPRVPVVFKELPKGWRKSILSCLEKLEGMDIISVLTN